jgi:hypothetical protein
MNWEATTFYALVALGAAFFEVAAIIIYSKDTEAMMNHPA